MVYVDAWRTADLPMGPKGFGEFPEDTGGQEKNN